MSVFLLLGCSTSTSPTTTPATSSPDARPVKRDARPSAVTPEPDGSSAPVIVADAAPKTDVAVSMDAVVPVDVATPPDAPPTLPDAMTVDPSGEFGYGGPSKCAGGGFLFCENFDNPLGANWKRNAPAGTSIALDSTRFARGKQAVKFHADLLGGTMGGGNGRKVYLETTSFPQRKKLWGRLFVWADSVPYEHGSFLELWGQATRHSINVGTDPQRWSDVGSRTYGYYGLGFQFHRYLANFQPPSTGKGTDRVLECSPTSTAWCNEAQRQQAVIPTKRWICVEFEFNGESGAVPRLFADGRALELGNYDYTHWAKFDSFDKLYLGFVMYHFHPSVDVWMDEFALDEQRIGCAR